MICQMNCACNMLPTHLYHRLSVLGLKLSAAEEEFEVKTAYTEPGLWYPLLPDESRLHLPLSFTGRSGKGNDFRLSLLLRETKLWTEPWQLRKPIRQLGEFHKMNSQLLTIFLICFRDRERMKHLEHDNTVEWCRLMFYSSYTINNGIH